MKKDEIKMEVSAKSSITFSVNGILSSSKQREHDTRTSPRIFSHETYSAPDRTNYRHLVSSPPTLTNTYHLPPTLQSNKNNVRKTFGHKDYTDYSMQSGDYYKNMTSYDIKERYSRPDWSNRVEHFHPYEHRALVLSPTYDNRHDNALLSSNYENRQAVLSPQYENRNPALSPQYESRTSILSPPSERNSPDSAESVISHNEKRSSPTGRFRPPPFFETVLTLRKRLYHLGGIIFPTNEPPTDRNVHKLWRAVEKHKVSYSLQHYFYVASLSQRCFDMVERIHHKVTQGLLEGSREKEVNQSYFNFLYGKTEDERYRLLLLLEKGEVSPKDFIKQKQASNARNEESCHNCQTTVVKLRQEKNEMEQKYNELKRKYDEMLLSNNDIHSEDPDENCNLSKRKNIIIEES